MCKEKICGVCHKCAVGTGYSIDKNVSTMLEDDTIIANSTGMSKSFVIQEKQNCIDRQGNVPKDYIYRPTC